MVITAWFCQAEMPWALLAFGCWFMGLLNQVVLVLD